MRQYLILLQKELQELITPVIILPLAITIVLFYGLGQLSSSEMEKAKTPAKIMVIDEDNSEASQQIETVLGQSNFELLSPTNNPLDDTKSNNGIAYLVIPQGFAAGLATGNNQKIEVHSVLTSLSAISLQKQNQVDMAVQAISKATSGQIISTQSALDTIFVQQPIIADNYVSLGGKETNASFVAISGYIQSQTYFIPIIVFMVIIFASQLVATSIASEKENKTLETLLSTPINRQTIVLAKLSAAALLALIFSVVYMFAMRSYINGITGEVTMGSSGDIGQSLADLGLKFGATQYTLLGLSLFAAIAVGLAIALILGAFAEDVKSIQSVITPLMVLIMIPYFISSFTDFNQLDPIVRNLMYLIPFTHPFMATNWLMQHEYTPIIWGIIYQVIVFIIFVYIGSKIFSSDRIMTMKFNFGKKR